MSEKINEVYSHYQIKICGDLSFTLVVHFNIKYICHLAIGWNNQDNVTLPFDKNVLILLKVSTFQSCF